MKKNKSVYVILLNPAVAAHAKLRKQNPNRNPQKPCVYVGMTGLSVEERFENHTRGYKASRYTTKYAIRLLPELYEHLNPLTYDDAIRAEITLAETLRNEGYTVAGGH
jgi:hypothetical protein